MNSTKRWLLGAGSVLLLSGLTAVGLGWFDRQTPLILKPDDVAVVANGKQIYQDNCASCHGVNLEGQEKWKLRNPEGKLPAPPHDKAGHTWHHADALLFELTKFGMEKYIGSNYRSDMPIFENVLSDKEIIEALSYIKSTWPAEIKKTHDKINASYAKRGSK